MGANESSDVDIIKAGTLGDKKGNLRGGGYLITPTEGEHSNKKEETTSENK